MYERECSSTLQPWAVRRPSQCHMRDDDTVIVHALTLHSSYQGTFCGKLIFGGQPNRRLGAVAAWLRQPAALRGHPSVHQYGRQHAGSGCAQRDRWVVALVSANFPTGCICNPEWRTKGCYVGSRGANDAQVRLLSHACLLLML